MSPTDDFNYTGVREYPDGRREWFLNGQLHRDDGPARESPDGSKSWYNHGKLHREDGPAKIWFDGSKLWFRNGICHRDDGPAIEWADGRKEWWRNDRELSPEEITALQPRPVPKDRAPKRPPRGLI